GHPRSPLGGHPGRARRRGPRPLRRAWFRRGAAGRGGAPGRGDQGRPISPLRQQGSPLPRRVRGRGGRAGARRAGRGQGLARPPGAAARRHARLRHRLPGPGRAADRAAGRPGRARLGGLAGGRRVPLLRPAAGRADRRHDGDRAGPPAGRPAHPGAARRADRGRPDGRPQPGPGDPGHRAGGRRRPAGRPAAVLRRPAARRRVRL
ncbi:MAG: Transcriptional regulator, AcrR family, partial [uncultured Corynebacteriales bacterium]